MLFKISAKPMMVRAFQRFGVSVLRDCITGQGLAMLENIAGNLNYKRRDLAINGTPRRLWACGGKQIVADPQLRALASKLYRDRDLRTALDTLAQDEVVDCDDAVEWIISSRMDRIGDTHGWHYDDYPFALVLIVSAPVSSAAGAEVEVEHEGGATTRLSLAKGDCYFMRSDRIRHRVAPLRRVGAPRIMFNFTYQSAKSGVTPKGSAWSLCDETDA